jgi:transcriptional regulator with XRE-family HTH domain
MTSTPVYSLAQLGAAIRTERQHASRTQLAIADAAGVQRQWLVQLENGRLPNPSVQKILAVVDVLGLRLAIEDDPDAERAR